MSTRATIQFKDEWDEVYIYRGHDGFPEVVLTDIAEVIELAEGRWSGSEMGQLISLFLARCGDVKQRIQDYEVTKEFHGDESYRYFVHWDKKLRKWIAGVI